MDKDTTRTPTPTWWKESVVYQIYPRSFYDSKGDGVGDLRGVIQKLDYVQDLGVDVVWLCPVYESPNDDNGYDISDYRAIAEEFGTLDDLDELLSELHGRGMKLIMDLVVNHTSDEHPWFVESRKSKDNPYRNFYIWRSGQEGQLNNWRSLFGGSAWQYDKTTGEYYLHLFSAKQPDLNWENPAVRSAIYEMMRWWLDRGIDGFRLDAINLISKAPGLPDAPATSESRYQFPGSLVFNGPRLYEFLREMKEEVLSHYDVLTVGEMGLITVEHAIELTHEETGSLNMLFQFEHLELDKDSSSDTPDWSQVPWSLVELKEVLTRWQLELDGGWNAQFFNNHDLPRAVSRFGDDGAYRVQSAKLLAALTHMLKGTPYIYQGEEIGMTNAAFDSISDYRDVATLNMYQELVEKGTDPQEVLALIQAKSRDNARTPVQWNASRHAGFTEGTPWIEVNPNAKDINVENSLGDPESILAFYKTLIELRRAHPVIIYGAYDLLLAEHEEIYAFTRTLEGTRLLVILNVSENTPTFKLPSNVQFAEKTCLISNYEVEPSEDIREVKLRAFEARVYYLA